MSTYWILGVLFGTPFLLWVIGFFIILLKAIRTKGWKKEHLAESAILSGMALGNLITTPSCWLGDFREIYRYKRQAKSGQ